MLNDWNIHLLSLQVVFDQTNLNISQLFVFHGVLTNNRIINHSKEHVWNMTGGAIERVGAWGQQGCIGQKCSGTTAFNNVYLVFILIFVPSGHLKFSERTFIQAGSLLTAAGESNSDIPQWIYGFLSLCPAIAVRNGLQSALWSAEPSVGGVSFMSCLSLGMGEVEGWGWRLSLVPAVGRNMEVVSWIRIRERTKEKFVEVGAEVRGKTEEWEN